MHKRPTIKSYVLINDHLYICVHQRQLIIVCSSEIIKHVFIRDYYNIYVHHRLLMNVSSPQTINARVFNIDH